MHMQLPLEMPPIFLFIFSLFFVGSFPVFCLWCALAGFSPPRSPTPPLSEEKRKERYTHTFPLDIRPPFRTPPPGMRKPPSFLPSSSLSFCLVVPIRHPFWGGVPLPLPPPLSAAGEETRGLPPKGKQKKGGKVRSLPSCGRQKRERETLIVFFPLPQTQGRMVAYVHGQKNGGKRASFFPLPVLGRYALPPLQETRPPPMGEGFFEFRPRLQHAASLRPYRVET